MEVLLVMQNATELAIATIETLATEVAFEDSLHHLKSISLGSDSSFTVPTIIQPWLMRRVTKGRRLMG